MSATRRRVALLGATGSIGTQTLDVLRLEHERFELVAVAGGRRLDELVAVAREFGVTRVAVGTEEQALEVRHALGTRVEVLVGPGGLADAAREADIVVNAVVGFAGLPATLATLEAGRHLALANKESLIAAAPLVERVRHTPGATILPIDSEHCAIHQCLAGSVEPGHPDVRRILLTASGGPFREWSAERLARATVADALRHPTWAMGPKITVDSSTLMNKGLEVLEASALFGIETERIEVVIHPQSIVHSMVEFRDGAVLAQLSRPDMRLPISYCLGLPERLGHRFGALDFAEPLALTFEPPDRERFAALDLAYEAARRGGAAPAWLSAANEVAVEAFLDGRIPWTGITGVVAAVMESEGEGPLGSVEELLEADRLARQRATDQVRRLAGSVA